MGRVNANTTLRVEDYPSTYRKDLLPRLFQTLNLLITQVVDAINGGIEFGSNIPSQDDAIEFNFAGVLPSFKWKLGRTPRFVLVGQALEDGVPVPIVITWSYSASNGLITVTSAVRLAAGAPTALVTGSNYKVSLRTLA